MKACNAVTRNHTAQCRFRNPNQQLSGAKYHSLFQQRLGSKPESNPRRAGSAFGFGGTNFHVTLEEYVPEYHAEVISEWSGRWEAYAGIETSTSSKPTMTHDELKAIEGGLLLLWRFDYSIKSKLSAISFNGPNFDDDPKFVFHLHCLKTGPLM